MRGSLALLAAAIIPLLTASSSATASSASGAAIAPTSPAAGILAAALELVHYNVAKFLRVRIGNFTPFRWIGTRTLRLGPMVGTTN